MKSNVENWSKRATFEKIYIYLRIVSCDLNQVEELNFSRL
jgi:hypothetical protein